MRISIEKLQLEVWEGQVIGPKNVLADLLFQPLYMQKKLKKSIL